LLRLLRLKLLSWRKLPQESFLLELLLSKGQDNE
jgi:hypothetical protein